MANIRDINNSLFKQMSYNDVVYDKLLKSYNTRLIQSYKMASIEIDKEVAKLYATLGDDISLLEAQKFNRLLKVQNNIKSELKKLGVAEINIDKKSILNSTSVGYTRSAYAYEVSFGSAMNFALLSKDALNASLMNPLSLIKWDESVKANINQLNGRINGKLAEGLIKGNSYKETAKEVEKVILEHSKGVYSGGIAKALRIVATETHRAYNLGSDMAFKKVIGASNRLGIDPPVKIWLATLDRKTRSSHASADGAKADKDGMFHLFGSTFSSPGNSGIVGEDVRCRCAYYTEVEGLKHTKRLDNESKKLVKNVSYKDWYENKYKVPNKGIQ